jgi:hypothetical protein
MKSNPVVAGAASGSMLPQIATIYEGTEVGGFDEARPYSQAERVCNFTIIRGMKAPTVRRAEAEE